MSLRRLFASHKRPYIVGLNNPDRIRVNLSGCELQLTLPPHYSSEGFEEAVPPRDIANIYATNLFDKYQESKPFGQVKFIRRDWSYFGPFWKSGDMGMTDFMATVMRVNCLPEGMSCLNPYHLEQVVMRLLYWTGPETPIYVGKIAPVNWRVEEKQGNTWILYEAHRERNSQFPIDPSYANFRSVVITAIDDRYIMCLVFNNYGSLPIDDSITACNIMRDKVLNSIRWQLSPSLQARKEVVLQQFSNTSISQHREPEPWVYPEWRDGNRQKGEPRYVQTKAGSPVPVFKP